LRRRELGVRTQQHRDTRDRHAGHARGHWNSCDTDTDSGSDTDADGRRRRGGNTLQA
jgi:hypothetical protein